MADTPDASETVTPHDAVGATDAGAGGGADGNVDRHAAPQGTLAAAIAGRGPHPLTLPAPLPLVVTLVDHLAEQLKALHAHSEAFGMLDPTHVQLRGAPGEPLRAELATQRASGEGTDEETGERDAFAISGFTAPERFEGERGIAGDQYALAALAYLLLTGEPPFAGAPAEQAFEQLFAAPEPPRVLNPALPFAVSTVILRALAKRPEDRYPSVGAFAAALRHAAGAAPGSAVPLPPWLRQTSAPSRPFVVARRESIAAFASQVPPAGLSALEEPPPSRLSEVSGEWRAAAPPPVTPPVPPQLPSRYPLLSERSRRIQIAVAIALLLALLMGAGLVMAASGPHPRRSAPPIVQAPPTTTPLPIVTLPPAPTSTPVPTATRAPTRTPVPTPSGSIEPVSSGDAATAGGVVAPASVAPRQRFTVTLTMINSGHTTWSRGAGYTLACDTVRHPATSCSSAFSAGLGGAIIPPGGRVTFTLTLVAPSGSGTYLAWFSMAHNGRLFPSSDASVRVAVG